jgi:hypothetical protein
MDSARMFYLRSYWFIVDMVGEQEKLSLADRLCFPVSISDVSFFTLPSANESSPAFLNASIGLLTTLINVYATQEGHWSVIAVVTAAISTFITLVSVVLYWLYVIWTKPAWEEHRDMMKRLHMA